MSGLELACLRMLRIYGPCPNAEVAARLKASPVRTYRAIYRLVQSGLADHAAERVYQITAKGKEAFARAHTTLF